MGKSNIGKMDISRFIFLQKCANSVSKNKIINVIISMIYKNPTKNEWWGKRGECFVLFESGKISIVQGFNKLRSTFLALGWVFALLCKENTSKHYNSSLLSLFFP